MSTTARQRRRTSATPPSSPETLSQHAIIAGESTPRGAIISDFDLDQASPLTQAYSSRSSNGGHHMSPKRLAQNRQAQRAFRMRHQAYVKELEEQSRRYEQVIAELHSLRVRFNQQADLLRQVIRENAELSGVVERIRHGLRPDSPDPLWSKNGSSISPVQVCHTPLPICEQASSLPNFPIPEALVVFDETGMLEAEQPRPSSIDPPNGKDSISY